ncbi:MULTISPECIES: universal stress protein [unclassified Microbulbifer]|uniref:universal stress protein n=1 Tax=unclassified Microbulbifer TaxID=2619833 RepID=UPI0027E548D5|nr:MULTISPECIES: universal stress protein [unclassified Microbulbifer]
MQNFHNILFVSHAIGDESGSLMQALSVARNNRAPVKVVVVCPELPEEFGEYKRVYMDALSGRVRESVKNVLDSLKLGEEELEVDIEVDCGSTPAERVIHRVQRDDYDLVVKSVEGKEQRAGFKAMDMELLRKCPCPVWLCRPVKHSPGDIRVAVAVDPDCREPNSYDLAIRLLRLSHSLADSCSEKLHIISCWDYDVDAYLRRNFPIDVSDEELDRAAQAARSRHRSKLDVLTNAANIGDELDIHHAIARPDRFIPLVIEEKKIDLLVMGTVGRTGIPGFIMGNTAENILQEISCSLLALKPRGYVSPVKVY